MALTKTLTANGSKRHHKFTLNISEDSTSGNSSFLSFTFQLAPIQSGWDWYGWGSGINYSITIGNNTYNGSIANYDGISTITLKSGNNIEITHDSNGAKTINVGFSVVDNTGKNYTCGNASSSDTFKLSDLHKAPDINSCTITSENNTQLSNLGLTANIIAQYLSKKNFQISCEAYDNAKISKIRILHNNRELIGYIVIGGSSTETVTLEINFSTVGELLTTIDNNKHYAEFIIEVTDDKNSVNTKAYSFEVIKYTKPSIEKTSSTIKRKTGGGTTLTDNEALLNFVGSIYVANDVIGNANSAVLQYKIWNGTEPSYSTTKVRQLSNNVLSYETNQLTSFTTVDTNITISNFQIDDVGYTKSYDYKIKISDVFIDSDTSDFVKTDKLSTGVAVWSEYKDHVDFLALSKEGISIYPNVYSSTETIIGIDNNEPRYRKVIDFDALPNGTTTKSVAHNISNLDMIKKIEIIGYDSTNQRWFPIRFAPVSMMYSNTSCSVRIDETYINIYSSSDWSSYTAEVTLEYTKIT